MSAVYIIEHGKLPDLDAAQEALNAILEDDPRALYWASEYKGFPPENGTPFEQGRQYIQEQIDWLRTEDLDNVNGSDYFWRFTGLEDKGIDLWILEADPVDMVTSATAHALGELEMYGLLTAAGFTNSTTEDSARADCTKYLVNVD